MGYCSYCPSFYGCISSVVPWAHGLLILRVLRAHLIYPFMCDLFLRAHLLANLFKEKPRILKELMTVTRNQILLINEQQLLWRLEANVLKRLGIWVRQKGCYFGDVVSFINKITEFFYISSNIDRPLGLSFLLFVKIKIEKKNL